MPNQPRPDNPARPVRVEDDLWHAALTTARDQGTTVSEVIRAALRAFVNKHQPGHRTTTAPATTPRDTR